MNMTICKGWKEKSESAYSFMLNYSKITVCGRIRPKILKKSVMVYLYDSNSFLHFFIITQGIVMLKNTRNFNMSTDCKVGDRKDK